MKNGEKTDESKTDETTKASADQSSSQAEAPAAEASAPPAPPPLPADVSAGIKEVTGVAGGAFALYGYGFATKGTLTVGGRQIEPTAWYTRAERGDTVIKALLPYDVTGRGVTVVSGGKTFTATLGKRQ